MILKARKRIGIIQKSDQKSFNWKMHGIDFGIDFYLQPGSAIKSPFFLLNFIRSKRKIPDFYIVRYLNDYTSLTKTLIRLFSEFFLFFICFLFKIKIFWLCHNVDKETESNYPLISKLRRNVVFSRSEAYFVTDPLLADIFIQHFKVETKNIYTATFGRLPSDIKNVEYKPSQEEKVAIDFIEYTKRKAQLNGHKVLVTLCAGTLNNDSIEKVIHFNFLPLLIEKAKENKFHIIVIIAGNWDVRISGVKKLDSIYQNYPHNIFNFKKYIQLEKGFIKQFVDFYFRGYTDFSVPYTVYEACSFEKPIVCLDAGFLPNLVSHNQIGEVIDLDMKNVDIILERTLNGESYRYRSFLESHTWGSLARNINYEYRRN